MTAEDNLKPNGLAGTLYTQEMFAEWGRSPKFVEMLTEMAGDESLPEQLRRTAVRYLAAQDQIHCMHVSYLVLREQYQGNKEILFDNLNFIQLESKYPLFQAIIE